ncbi:MAG: peroxiredoxin family protein [bacterium]
MNKYIMLSFVGVVILAGVFYLSARGSDVADTLHNLSHDAGFCECDAFAATVADVQDRAASCANNSSCLPSSNTAALTQFTDDEQNVVDYICDQVMANGKTNFDDDELEKATGVSVQAMNNDKLKAGVLAELNRRNFNFGRLSGGSYCSKFSACSVDRDLSGASGEELERYQFEKSQDAKPFENFHAPDFTLPTTHGRQASLSDYRGKPVALVFLSGHCSHSFDTLPILAELHKKYDRNELVILPVYVNSGSVNDILTWSSKMKLGFPLVVSPNKKVSNAYHSRMVPSTFLIDRQGQVIKKYVGFKNKDVLDRAFSKLVKLQSQSQTHLSD